MKTQDIRNMGLAYLEVLEGKDSAARRAQKAAWDAEDNAVLAKAHAVNKHGHDHVGQEDDDVNNDKKTDSTDKYLLNRRKAISANIRKEETEEVDEAAKAQTLSALTGKASPIDDYADMIAKFKAKGGSVTKVASKELDDKEKAKLSATFGKTGGKGGSAMATGEFASMNKRDAKYNAKQANARKKSMGMKEEADIDEAKKAKPGHNASVMAKNIDKVLAAVKKEEIELDEISANTLGKYSIKAAQQRGSDKRVAGQKMADDKVRKKYGYSSSAKVAAESTEWPVFARIQEKLTLPSYKVSGTGDDPHEVTVKFATDPHTKGATAPEKIDSKASDGEKDWVKLHGGLNGNESGINAKDYTAKNAIAHTNNVKVAPGRHNDQKIGDKAPLKSKS